MRPTNSILGQHFTIARQLRFTLPRMLMSLFIMSYMVADGVLISRYMGTVADRSSRGVWVGATQKAPTVH